MISGKTNPGFAFELSEDVLDDYELLEVLCDVDAGEYGKVPEVVKLLLGEEQKNKLKEHIRKENGKVSANLMLSEVTDIFNSTKSLKN